MQATLTAKPEGQHCQLLGGSDRGKQERLQAEQQEHRRCHPSAAVKLLPQCPLGVGKNSHRKSLF